MGAKYIYQKMLKESLRLEKQIKQLKGRIEELREGKLICVKNGKYVQYYNSDGHVKTYIPKKNRKLAEELAVKKYLSALLEDLQKEKRAVDSYLKYYPKGEGKAENLLTKESFYKELISPYFKTKSKQLQEWMQEPFNSNTQYSENLIFKTISGHMVRSKSEVMIDTLLYINNIPFRYECELKVGKKVYYPDFTIKHPRTRKLYYWEHFGRMDDENYIRKTYLKLQNYAIHGIIPSVNLIMTFENKEHPLTEEIIMWKIERYFA